MDEIVKEMNELYIKTLTKERDDLQFHISAYVSIGGPTNSPNYLKYVKQLNNYNQEINFLNRSN